MSPQRPKLTQSKLTADVAVGSIATETPCPRNVVASAHFVGDVKSHVTRPPTRIRCTLVFDTDTKSLYVEREVAHLDARVDGTIEMQTAIMDIADLRLDDDRLSAAVSRAGFSPAVGVGRTTACERITDPSQTSRHVRAKSGHTESPIRRMPSDGNDAKKVLSRWRDGTIFSF